MKPLSRKGVSDMAKKDLEMVVAANNAITIASKIEAAVARIIADNGECSDETLAELQQWQGALEVKAANIGLAKTRLDADAEYYKSIEEAARARRKAVEASSARLKLYLRDCMQVAGVKSIRGDLFSFSLVQGRVKAVIENKELLPYEFTGIVEVINPKTDAIKAALEAGTEVPGAHLERGEDYVMIRQAGRKETEDA